jgi:hypothetical protein
LETIYAGEGSQVHCQLFYNALSQLLTKPYVKADMPSCGRINLLHQPQENRYVVHVTYGTPHQRGRAQVIEDLVPLHHVPVTVHFEEKINTAYSIPDQRELEMINTQDGIRVIIPEFRCHTGIVFEY